MKGEVILDRESRANPKAQWDLKSHQTVHLNTPGGGGYGDPFSRDPELVWKDVVAGYVTPEAAARDYGVVIRFTGGPDELVRLPEQWLIDEAATGELRKRMKDKDEGEKN
jgi:N-methylhydantoinase B